MNIEDEAIELCKKMYCTTLGMEFNDGKPLPISVAKKLAEIAVWERIKMLNELYNKKQIGVWEYVEMSNHNSELRRKVQNL